MSMSFLAAAFAHVAPAYLQSSRHYHNILHVIALLDEAVRRGVPLPDKMIVALVFHDYVYDPRVDRNEYRSAEAAEVWARARGMSDADVRFVWDAIQASAHMSRDARPVVDELLLAFLDLDLSILAAPQNIYDRYASQIRREYHFVPEETYREHRGAVLLSFLGRTRIFRSSYFTDEDEERARRNVQHEIDRLRTPIERRPSIMDRATSVLMSLDLLETALDDEVDAWHDGRAGMGLSLHEHLGMTWEEYALYVERARAGLSEIMLARVSIELVAARNKQSVEEAESV